MRKKDFANKLTHLFEYAYATCLLLLFRWVLITDLILYFLGCLPAWAPHHPQFLEGKLKLERSLLSVDSKRLNFSGSFFVSIRKIFKELFLKFIYDRLALKIQIFDRDLTDIQATTSSNDRIVSNLPAKPDQSDAANANLIRVRGLSSSIKRDKYFWRSLGAFWAILNFGLP